MVKQNLVQQVLSDKEMRTIIHYARGKFLEEGWPMSAALRSVRAALGKMESKPVRLPVSSQDCPEEPSGDRQPKTEAARFRAAAETATTSALRAPLLEEAEQQERLARDEQEGRGAG